jgi:glycosyltransferase involved in cell wall biosynthesis
MARYLAETIESVLSQDYPHIEYIVMDGGSTDGSLEILERYRGRIRYTTGPDAGPADAIHRGFALAKGEILAWINADDTYLPGAVRTAAEYLQAHPNVDVVYGEAYWIDEHGDVIDRYPTQPFDPTVLKSDCFICQPASFLRASAYRQCSLDPAQLLAFDYDLWIRMSKQHCRFDMLPHYLANSRMHNECLTLRKRRESFEASIDLLKRHYGYVPFPWVLAYTAHGFDGRDQFFEPLQTSLLKDFAAFPLALRLNPRHIWRVVGEWLRVCGGEVKRLAKPMPAKPRA